MLGEFNKECDIQKEKIIHSFFFFFYRYMRSESLNHKFVYESPITTSRLVSAVADSTYFHILYSKRKKSLFNRSKKKKNELVSSCFLFFITDFPHLSCQNCRAPTMHSVLRQKTLWCWTSCCRIRCDIFYLFI